MRTHWMWIVLAAVLVGTWTVPVLADDEGGDRPRAERPRRERPRDDADAPKLTEEQREQVRALMEAFRTDMERLRAALREAREKLRDLRQSEADEEAIQKQMAVVKRRMEAIKVRVRKLVADMKEVLPADAFRQWRERFEARLQELLGERGDAPRRRVRPRAPEGEGAQD